MVDGVARLNVGLACWHNLARLLGQADISGHERRDVGQEDAEIPEETSGAVKASSLGVRGAQVRISPGPG
jgi:hypothetical protein